MEAPPAEAPNPNAQTKAATLAWTECVLAALTALLIVSAVSSHVQAADPETVTLIVLLAVSSFLLGWGATEIKRSGTLSSGPLSWTGIDVILVLAGGFAGGQVAGAIVANIGFGIFPQASSDALHPNAALQTAISLIVQATLDAVLLANLWAMGMRRHGTRLRDLGWRAPRDAGRLPGWLVWIPAGALIGVIAFFVGSLSLDVISSFFPNATNPQCGDVLTSYGQFPAVAILVVSVIAPVAEETFFRGFAYRYMARRWNVPAGIVLSGLLFGLFHGIPLLFISLSLVGVLLACTYAASDSLVPGMVAHGVFNLIGVVGILENKC